MKSRPQYLLLGNLLRTIAVAPNYHYLHSGQSMKKITSYLHHWDSSAGFWSWLQFYSEDAVCTRETGNNSINQWKSAVSIRLSSSHPPSPLDSFQTHKPHTHTHTHTHTHIGIILQLRHRTDLDQLNCLIQYKTATDRHKVESSGDEEVKTGPNSNTNTLSADSQHNRWGKSPPSVQRINLPSNRHQSAGNQAGITCCHRNHWFRGCLGLLCWVKYQNATLLSKQWIRVYNHFLPHTTVPTVYILHMQIWSMHSLRFTLFLLLVLLLLFSLFITCWLVNLLYFAYSCCI